MNEIDNGMTNGIRMVGDDVLSIYMANPSGGSRF
jgi:hypothetical protein